MNQSQCPACPPSGGVNAANNWNFTAAAVCLQEVAVVPVLGDWVGDHANNCSNGNVVGLVKTLAETS
ncbi:hypothetical protein [Catenulispora pinisilvae]|uniref:hypothetical protein n=1 Tax=Catenulispora pinisilvae TaxID=2705253 RepID=UPI0018922248